MGWIARFLSRAVVTGSNTLRELWSWLGSLSGTQRTTVIVGAAALVVVMYGLSRSPGIVLDCEGIDYVDSQGSAKMDDAITLADDPGITLRLARLKPAVRVTLTRDGIIDCLGQDRIDGNLRGAMQTHAEPTAASAPEGLRRLGPQLATTNEARESRAS